MAIKTKAQQPLEVAVIGGGVVGLALVTGLLYRGVSVKVYEKSSSFRPVGAGIGFTPNAMRALGMLHPKALEAQQKVATANGDPDDPNDWIRYLDAYHHNSEEDEEVTIFKLYCGRRGFEGCVRADFMNELLKIIPDGIIEFGKSLENIIDRGDDEKVLMQFRDGTTAEADIVIGCDGIKSEVRKIILGKNHLAAEPSYNHQYALRGLVPMDKAIAALGEYKGRNRHMHLGPGSYVATVPVALGKAINLVAFIQDPDEWPDTTQLTAPADKEKVLQAFNDFGRPVRNLIRTVVDTSPRLDKWGIFDCVDRQSPTFTKGRVCIAGDAAHAASPHHGAGAGMGMEDNLVLAVLLAEVATSEEGQDNRAASIRAALTAYSNVRLERTQWVAESSRTIGELLEWRYPPTMSDWEKCEAELTWRSHKIWHHDQEAMLRTAQADYERILHRTIDT
ncbi:hypothetical protein OIDMADRAFT_45885 [Oidiodendron maius Zn]|uniref:FAD-binding domain-containing protein n=1 Tax=Oidiodendron maius (strain Zn) TaxID=913774 RepID=A0A0C3GS17_OIDMZ|nr:hypothetical protein OIDMADRAFT_45885 [Oidiodendron maius Zn]